MEEQKRLSPDEIREAFQESKKGITEIFINTEAAKAIDSLSAAIAELQNNNIDVHLTFHISNSENAFLLALTLSNDPQLQVIASGILYIGEQEHLFALQTLENGQPALKFHLSSMDIRQQGTTPLFRSKVYNFGTDPLALNDLQRDIIIWAALNEVHRDMDTKRSFDDSGKFHHKPPYKPGNFNL